jgi:V8-like Glu-specific endopeptidase
MTHEEFCKNWEDKPKIIFQKTGTLQPWFDEQTGDSGVSILDSEGKYTGVVSFIDNLLVTVTGKRPTFRITIEEIE